MPVNSICHPELVSESQNKEIDSGSEAGMTKPLPVYLPCHSELDSESINVDNRLRLAGRSDQLSRKAAFTMAEVLITLGIIGIVAAMTLPTVINRAQRKILTQQFKKSYATVQNAINLAQSEWGAPYECYNTGFGEYHLDECEAFWDAFLKNVKIIQKCDGDDYDCHPKYKTVDEVLADGGEMINDNCSMDLVNFATFYILYDGTYLIVNDNFRVNNQKHHKIYFGIDINGSKGPNKWGYDLYYLTLNREDLKKDVIVANEVCAMKEKGGMYINEMLLE